MILPIKGDGFVIYPARKKVRVEVLSIPTEFRINSQNHYRLVKDGDSVEVYEYGKDCPCSPDSEKKLLGKVSGKDKVSWYVIPYSEDAEEMTALVAPEDVESDTIWCGDDFIAELLTIKHKATIAKLMGK